MPYCGTPIFATGRHLFLESTPAIRSEPCRLVANPAAAIPAIWYDSCNHHRGAAHHCRVHVSALVPLVPVLWGDRTLVGAHATNSGNPSRTATIRSVAGRVCISVCCSTSQVAGSIVAGRTPRGRKRPLLQSIPAGAPIRLGCAPAQSRTTKRAFRCRSLQPRKQQAARLRRFVILPVPALRRRNRQST